MDLILILQEIGREFEKLIIGGNCKIPNNAQTLQNERLENDNSPAELVIDDTIENGFDENIDNIEIGESNEETIELFVSHSQEEVTVIETDDIPPDIQVELYTNQNKNIIEEQNANNPIVNENTTDGNIFSVHRTSSEVVDKDCEIVLSCMQICSEHACSIKDE